MLENKNQMKKDLIERYYIEDLIEKINYCHKIDTGWKLSDLVDQDKQKDYYILNIYKGFLLMLLISGHIEIFSNFGNQQYVFKSLKKIEF